MYEIICWIVLFVAVIAFSAYMWRNEDGRSAVEITDKKLKAWEKQEKEWW